MSNLTASPLLGVTFGFTEFPVRTRIIKGASSDEVVHTSMILAFLLFLFLFSVFVFVVGFQNQPGRPISSSRSSPSSGSRSRSLAVSIKKGVEKSAALSKGHGPPSKAKNGRNKVDIELYLDLVCPQSSKMFIILYNDVLPEVNDGKEVSLVLHQVIQPWHPQGTMVHEAALAVKRVAPDAYLGYINSIYKAFTSKGQFQDEKTWSKSRMEIYDDLLAYLPKSVDKLAVKALLEPTGKGGNEGNSMTEELKRITTFHRSKGVHSTPTVIVNGKESKDVSSEWSKGEWLSFLSK